MEGPTPVSALIHAATMVTAGVYLMVPHQPAARRGARRRHRSIAIVGAVTALFAATIAVAQNDIKKVLAYSTISQLGYMFLAVGLRRLRGRHLPHDHPRLLQGPAVPRRRLGHPRHARRAGHAAHGRAPQGACRSPSCHASSSAGWPSPACRRSPGFWSKDEILRQRLGQEPGAVGRRPGHGAAHRLLHEPPGVPGLLRQGPLGRGPTRPAPRPRRRARRRRRRRERPWSTPTMATARRPRQARTSRRG